MPFGTGGDLNTMENVVHFSDFFLNGSNNSMDVDGSTTPQVFSIGPSGTQCWFVKSISLFITDGGNMDYEDYGSINELPNGVLVELEKDGTDYEIANLRDNCGLTLSFNRMTIGTNEKSFMKDDQIYVGSMDFDPPLILNGATSDVVKATVRDNITGLNEHKMKMHAWRLI